MLVIAQARANGIFAEKGGEGEEQEQNMGDENDGEGEEEPPLVSGDDDATDWVWKQTYILCSWYSLSVAWY